MEILTKAELQVRYDEIIEKIKAGLVFIHPTDTIYGLSCDATNAGAVEQIHKLKERTTKPFSVWAPSIDWIRKNCVIDEKAEQWLQKLPGPYTLILKLKKKNAIAENVILGSNTIGIRYPDHWFRIIVERLGLPLVTTSANKTGQPFMTTIENLDSDVEKGVEFIIYEGLKEARPSKIVNIVEEKVQER